MKVTLNAAELAEWLNVSISTTYRLTREDGFPKPISALRKGKRGRATEKRWVLEDVQQWMEQNRPFSPQVVFPDMAQLEDVEFDEGEEAYNKIAEEVSEKFRYVFYAIGMGALSALLYNWWYS